MCKNSFIFTASRRHLLNIDLVRKEFVILDWFMFNIWIFMLIAGITLLILSGNIRYILWVKGRIGISEEKVRTIEKNGAIFLIVYAIIKLLQLFI